MIQKITERDIKTHPQANYTPLTPFEKATFYKLNEIIEAVNHLTIAK